MKGLAEEKKEPFLWVKLGRETQAPEFKEVRGKDWVFFGADNKWPEQTLRLFRDCSDHRAIVRGKSRYITGKGLALADQDSSAIPFFSKVNRYEALSDVYAKTVTDWELHRGFYVRIKWTRKSTIYMLEHVPFHQVRSNADGSVFYICKKWGDKKHEANMETLSSLENSDRVEDCIFYFSEWDPASDTYPLPEYIAAMRYMNIDTETANFHDNNVSSGFTAGTMITLFRGEPPPEEKRELTTKIKAKSTGTDQAGEVLIYFADQTEKEPKIDPLRSNDLDKQYLALAELVQQKIFTSHQVTNPQLFGIKTPGALGSKKELMDAWELLDANYVTPQQDTLVRAYETMFELCGMPVSLKVEKLEPVGQDLLELFKAGVISKDLLVQIMGLPVEDATKIPEGADALQKAINALSPLVANKVLEKLDDLEIRSMVGLTEPKALPAPALESSPQGPVGPNGPGPDPAGLPAAPEPVKMRQQIIPHAVRLWAAHVPGPDGSSFTHAPILGRTLDEAREWLQVNGMHYVSLSGDEIQVDGLTDEQIQLWHDDQDLAIFAEFGSLESEFEILESMPLKLATGITEDQSKLLAAVSKNPKASLAELAGLLWIEVPEVTRTLGDLIKKDLLKPAPSSGGGMVVTPGGQLVIDEMGDGSVIISTKYRYNGPRDNKNRPFCARLMDLGKIYDREEIDMISARLGYDVWKRRGGWYRVPNSDPALNIPHCRHNWEQIIVRRTAK